MHRLVLVMRNRPSQSKFACRWGGSVKHADVDAARVIAQRRSLGLGEKWLGKAAILGALVKLHTGRFPRPLGTAADPRMDNPYFKSWARAARMLEAQSGKSPDCLALAKGPARTLETQGVVRCA